MGAPAPAVVCEAARAPATSAAAARVELTGVVRRGRRFRLPAGAGRAFASVAEALDAGAAPIIALTPYADMAADAELCRRHGVGFVPAGPTADGTTPAPGWPARWAFHPALRQALALRQRQAFGAPVYLRFVVGGGSGLDGAWWSLLEGLETAQALLGPATHLWVAATRGGRRWHATLTATTAAGASAQIGAVPAAAAGEDLLLLGTGGLGFGEPGAGAVVHGVDGDARLAAVAPVWPDGAWLAAGLAGHPAPLPSTVAGDLAQALRTALRTACRRRCPVEVVP